MNAAHAAPRRGVLVTGGTGKTGARVAARLRALGHVPRVAARHPGADGVRFDWDDAATYDDALAGVDAVYLVAPVGAADPLPPMRALVDAALARGVQRFVLLSASALPEEGPAMGAVHGYLRRRAPEWAVLQPSWFMQNLAADPHRATIRADGVIMTATGNGRVPFIDADDIAAVAVHALVDAAPHNRAHLLTGPEALSYDAVSAAISPYAGRPVRHQRVTPETLAGRWAQAGLPPDYARLLAAMDAAIAGGAEDRTTTAVRDVTGRAPRTFAQFAEASAAAWAAQAPPGGDRPPPAEAA